MARKRDREPLCALCVQVMVLKNPADDLGMAIIGGIEHNLPIIISEVFPNSAVSRASKVEEYMSILTYGSQGCILYNLG